MLVNSQWYFLLVYFYLWWKRTEEWPQTERLWNNHSLKNGPVLYIKLHSSMVQLAPLQPITTIMKKLYYFEQELSLKHRSDKRVFPV